ALAARVGCEGSRDPAACLRGKSANAIAAALPESYAGGGHKFGPIIDGVVLPKKPLETVEDGTHAPIPLIVGTTSNEFSTMVHNSLDGPPTTEAEYAALLGKRFPYVAKQLLAKYPAANFASPLAAYTAVWSAAAFTCPSEWLTSAAASRGPTYRFIFDHT